MCVFVFPWVTVCLCSLRSVSVMWILSFNENVAPSWGLETRCWELLFMGKQLKACMVMGRTGWKRGAKGEPQLCPLWFRREPYWLCDSGQRIGTLVLSFFVWKMGIIMPTLLTVLRIKQNEVCVFPGLGWVFPNWQLWWTWYLGEVSCRIAVCGYMSVCRW